MVKIKVVCKLVVMSLLDYIIVTVKLDTDFIHLLVNVAVNFLGNKIEIFAQKFAIKIY